MTRTILLVEDDASISRGVAANLKSEGYDVITAADGEKGMEVARAQLPDLVILDVMLPRIGGFDICRTLRAEGFQSPILMLTARGEESDRVFGLDLGADDYLTKPFAIRELLARVRALLRRGATVEGQPSQIRVGDVVVDFLRFEARRSDESLQLTRKEFGTLRFLAGRNGEVVTRDELLTSVWEYQQQPTTRTVDNHIASLRQKLESDPARPKFLLTVHGVGYKLVLT